MSANRKKRPRKRADAVTYRDKMVDICHQKVVRDRAAEDKTVRALFPSPDNVSLKGVQIRRISRNLAWKVISRYEWLGTLPPCAYYFGAMFDGSYLGGVSCVRSTTGASPWTPKWLGVPTGQIGYLARGACVHWAPKGTAPKLINWTGKLLEQYGFQVMLAYSDIEAGEIGTVYQAAGWTCLGFGSSHGEYVSPEGRVLNCMVENSLRRTYGCTRAEARRLLIKDGWKLQKSTPKLRYVKVLKPGRKNPRLMNRIEVDSIAYPKRIERQSGSGSPTFQLGDGGATPTLALHSSDES